MDLRARRGDCGWLSGRTLARSLFDCCVCGDASKAGREKRRGHRQTGLLSSALGKMDRIVFGKGGTCAPQVAKDNEQSSVL